MTGCYYQTEAWHHYTHLDHKTKGSSLKKSHFLTLWSKEMWKQWFRGRLKIMGGGVSVSWDMSCAEKRKTPYLDLVRCQAAFHVAALFLGWRRGRLVSRGEVSPVGGKRKQTDTRYPESAFMRPWLKPYVSTRNEESCPRLPLPPAGGLIGISLHCLCCSQCHFSRALSMALTSHRKRER